MKVRLMALLFALSLVLGLPLVASAGPASPTGMDTDGDGIENAFDNCVGVGNVAQVDGDHDGCGNSCTQAITCDATGDTAVGIPDFQALGNEFGNDCVANPGDSCTADCNGDNKVGIPDFQALGGEFGNVVGPSGITTAQCNPSTCQCTPQ